MLSADFQLAHASLSAPIEYQQLADKLGVKLGGARRYAAGTEAVLELRRSKGMVLDPTDPDTCSCGSFFTNPIISNEDALKLPAAAPRFPVYDLQLRNSVTGVAPKLQGLVKTSAAWLISHAGFSKGFTLDATDGSGQPVRASLSNKHVLALTNRGPASSADIAQLAATIKRGVWEKFGVELVEEPVQVGF